MAESIVSADYAHNMAGKLSHYHDRHQILYIKSGVASITIDHRHYQAKAGAIVLISRYERHSIKVESADYARYSVHISPAVSAVNSEQSALLSVLVNRPDNFRHVIDTHPYEHKLDGLFEEILSEMENRGQMNQEMLNLLLFQVLIMLFRLLPENFYIADSKHAKIVQDIQTLFSTQYFQTYSLNSLAEQYNLSPYYLSHMFKKATGYSVMGHLQTCRIVAAKKYLAESEYDVSEIVELCAFSDHSNFTRVFKRHTGCTPSQFREKYRKH